MDKYRIILFAGSPGSGKDSCCDYLINSYGFKKIAFADKLREIASFILHEMYDCDVSLIHFIDRTLKESFIKKNNGEFWLSNGVKITYRQFLRVLGTDCFREKINRTTWIDYVNKLIISEVTKSYKDTFGICIPDWRFPDEYDGIKALLDDFGNVIELQTVFISREGYDFIGNDHIEGLLKEFKFDFYIKNNENLIELFKKVDKVITGSYLKEKILNEQLKRGNVRFI